MPIQEEIAETMHNRNPPPPKNSTNKWNKYLDYQGDWLEKTRGNLMIVATVIASMAFQAAMNPPSQLWKNDYSQNKECKAGMIKECKAGMIKECKAGMIKECKAGMIKECKAGMIKDAFKDKRIIEARNLSLNCIEKYSSQVFIICNTVSFSASLSIIFLLTVLPLKNRFSLWILLVAICITVIFTSATYIISIGLVEVQDHKQERFNDEIFSLYFVFWVGLLAVILVFFTLKLLFWLLKNLLIGVWKLLQKLKVKKKPAVRV